MSCENDNALIAIIKSINQEVKKRIPNATEKSMCKKENMEIVLSAGAAENKFCKTLHT